MRAAVMQPYFFPYLGYFSLIKHTDRFIFLDTVQFIKHGWIERNRILKPDGGWQYFNVPLVGHSSFAKIKDVRVDNSVNWRRRILSQVGHYKRKAPYYRDTMEVLDHALSIDTDSIVKLDEHALKSVCRYLDIPANFNILTEMELKYDVAQAADEWSLNICRAMGIEEYWNPEGGIKFFDCGKYDAAGIIINFLKINLKPYYQAGCDFEPGLSILDAMMFNSPESIKVLLNDFILLPRND